MQLVNKSNKFVLLLFVLSFICFGQLSFVPAFSGWHYSNSGHYLKEEQTKESTLQTDSIAQLWDELMASRACIGGFQDINKTREIEAPRRLFFSLNIWNSFASNNKEAVTVFLLSKLKDTTLTTIHTCPFLKANTNEMAVYALQHIHQVNWFDFEEYSAYKDRDILNGSDQPQKWLQELLNIEEEREKLTQLFLNQLKQ